MNLKSPALNQLECYAKTHPNDNKTLAQTVTGIVFPTLSGSLGVGPQGPLLLQDIFLIERIQTTNRERIPERLVHAKGAGKVIHIL